MPLICFRWSPPRHQPPRSRRSRRWSDRWVSLRSTARPPISARELSILTTTGLRTERLSATQPLRVVFCLEQARRSPCREKATSVLSFDLHAGGVTKREAWWYSQPSLEHLTHTPTSWSPHTRCLVSSRGAWTLLGPFSEWSEVYARAKLFWMSRAHIFIENRLHVRFSGVSLCHLVSPLSACVCVGWARAACALDRRRAGARYSCTV